MRRPLKKPRLRCGDNIKVDNILRRILIVIYLGIRIDVGHS
jgi:hypothetical protein